MRVSLFGYGKTTRAIASLFGGGFDFYDDNITEGFIDRDGNIVYPSSQFDPKMSDIEILTPSINPNSKLLAKAKNPVSEYDLFLSDFLVGEFIKNFNKEPFKELVNVDFLTKKRPRTVWISGTNGKTTTTQMLTHLLSKHGAISGGNIGTPLANLDFNAPLWILETSSFTLHHTKYAYPDIYILLPITPDHLNWHGGDKGYIEAKLSPLKRMREGDLALIPKGFKRPKSSAWVVEYDSNLFLEEFFNLDASKLRYKSAFLQDALLALATARVLFDEVDYELLNSFELDAHRQQELKDKKGRLWVNDSKATNLDASLVALDAYKDKKIHLIAGGDDKGVDMSPLFRKLQELDAKVYAIGSNRDRLLQLAREYDIEANSFNSLKDAILAIDRELKLDEVALLSPGASSLDQFNSYIHRGEEFMSQVKNLS